MRPNSLATLLCVGLAGCVAAPAPAPPQAGAAPRVEAVPPPPATRTVWQPGAWRHNGDSYVWVPGHYVQRVVAYHRWVPAHLNQAGVWVAGHWI